jgi:hypothetical protein
MISSPKSPHRLERANLTFVLLEATVDIMHANVRPCPVLRRLSRPTAFLSMAVLAFTGSSLAQQLITFDAPNSGTNKLLGTAASGINLEGEITGDVSDNLGGVHGYVRAKDGSFVEFDVPGANPSAGLPCLYGAGGTCPAAINNRGEVTGNSGDASGVYHGFLRDPDGKITVFDVPEAGEGKGQGTLPYAINNSGLISGIYVDAESVGHGFIRFPDGRITTFDDPAAGKASGQGTYPDSMNDHGTVSGWETDSKNLSHGFIRFLDGKFTTFDAPGSAASTYGMADSYINNFGVAAGSFWKGAGNVSHGFQRERDGEITEYQIPKAGDAPFEGAYIGAINDEGTTTGYVTDANVENHSFVRYANGKVIVFDVPGQLLLKGSGFGSAGEAINGNGVVAGRWHDVNDVLHAYVWIP